ncbi:MAG: flavin reductase family protein [Candidatus Micrarchaeota archaeon]
MENIRNMRNAGNMESTFMEKPYHLLTPMRVTLISASNKGKDNFMPASWCFPLSFEPALFGVAIAPKRFTHDMINESKEYVINIPGMDLKEKIEKFGRISGKNCDKFKASGLTQEKSESVRAVSIKECLASIECKVISEFTTGDHTIFVGKVHNIKIRKRGKGIYNTQNSKLIVF